MGLDMYLTRKTYVKNWPHMKPEERHTVTITGPDASSIKPERISYIEEEIGYWRKANAIHQWFVDNVQNGVDDCRDSYVSREKLDELLTAVNAVLFKSALIEGDVTEGWTSGKGTTQLVPIRGKGMVVADTQVAQDLLPTTSGFFFGSTDYDEYYVEDLKRTKEIIEAALAMPDTGSFVYHSSW